MRRVEDYLRVALEIGNLETHHPALSVSSATLRLVSWNLRSAWLGGAGHPLARMAKGAAWQGLPDVAQHINGWRLNKKAKAQSVLKDILSNIEATLCSSLPRVRSRLQR